MRRDKEPDLDPYGARRNTQTTRDDWHNVHIGPDFDFERNPDYDSAVSGYSRHLAGRMALARTGGRGYDPDHDRSSDDRYRGRGEDLRERGPWRASDRDERRSDWRERDWDDRRGYDRETWDDPDRANRGYERNYGRGYDREFGQGYERGMGRDYGRHAGPEAREGYTRPGNYDASFERGAYRRDDDDLYGMGAGPHVGRGPKGYTRAPERIREDICDRLTRHGHLDATHIDIRVEGDEVTLEGEVDSRTAKRLAENLAESVRGVRDVHNRLRINHDLHAGMAPTAAAEPAQETTFTTTRQETERTPKRSSMSKRKPANGKDLPPM